ncbi:MAG: MBOAT family protein, partial [Crocinitomicaceae bacterium]|nr:MBOAT family protein [Crocinitomicaceae bacterium]
MSIFLNIGLLVVFKYAGFIQTILHDILWLFGAEYTPVYSDLILPVGISFYTFQTLSYSIDVYRQQTQVEKHFGKFALYVSFFPQLVAGPIERAQDLLAQFNNKRLFFQSQDFKDGLLLFTWGLFKKVVVADNARALADFVFNNA